MNIPAHPAEVQISPEQRQTTIENIKQLLQDRNATLVAHYYTDPEIQALAEATGGCVADSLEMARFGANADAEMVVDCSERVSTRYRK